MVYLAKADVSDAHEINGLIEWQFDFSNKGLTIKRADLYFRTMLYRDGKVDVDILHDGDLIIPKRIEGEITPNNPQTRLTSYKSLYEITRKSLVLVSYTEALSRLTRFSKSFPPSKSIWRIEILYFLSSHLGRRLPSIDSLQNLDSFSIRAKLTGSKGAVVYQNAQIFRQRLAYELIYPFELKITFH